MKQEALLLNYPRQHFVSVVSNKTTYETLLTDVILRLDIARLPRHIRRNRSRLQTKHSQARLFML